MGYLGKFCGTALLATKGLDSPKHSGIISLFNQHFVKEDIIDKSLGKILASAKDAREESDYGDFTIVTSQEAAIQLKNAKLFIDKIEKMIDTL